MQHSPTVQKTFSKPFAAASPPQILFAEDHPADGRFLATALSGAGYKVTLECNAHQVFDQVMRESRGQCRFDLVILDLSMNTFDVVFIAQRLRLASCRIPILAITGSNNDSLRQQYLDAGCDSHLTKPVGKPQLFYEVGRLLLHRYRQGNMRAHQHPGDASPSHGLLEKSRSAVELPSGTLSETAQ